MPVIVRSTFRYMCWAKIPILLARKRVQFSDGSAYFLLWKTASVGNRDLQLPFVFMLAHHRGYSWWGVGKVEPGPELFFLMPAPAQLSAYANHELKNWYYLAKVARRQTAWAKYWSRAYAQLERNIIYIMNLLCSKTSENSSTYA